MEGGQKNYKSNVTLVNIKHYGKILTILGKLHVFNGRTFEFGKIFEHDL